MRELFPCQYAELVGLDDWWWWSSCITRECFSDTVWQTCRSQSRTDSKVDVLSHFSKIRHFKMKQQNRPVPLILKSEPFLCKRTSPLDSKTRGDNDTSSINEMQQWPPERAGSEGHRTKSGLWVAKRQIHNLEPCLLSILQTWLCREHLTFEVVKEAETKHKTWRQATSNRKKKITSAFSLTNVCITPRKKGRDSLAFCEYPGFLLCLYTLQI